MTLLTFLLGITAVTVAVLEAAQGPARSQPHLPLQFEVASATGNTAPSDPSGPSIFTAIQERLGVKLESSKAPAQVPEIDSVQKPSEN